MKIIITFLMLLCLSKLMAQHATVSTGMNNATGTGGSTTYSIGQVNFINATGSTGSVTLGVQQPFEIVTLGADDFPDITLAMTLYPNPTTDRVTLSISNHDPENMEYQLFDINGRNIRKDKIAQAATEIKLEDMAAAIYLLQVSNEKKILKTFKIIKN